jgi:hypothetical protein
MSRCCEPPHERGVRADLGLLAAGRRQRRTEHAHLVPVLNHELDDV